MTDPLSVFIISAIITLCGVGGIWWGWPVRVEGDTDSPVFSMQRTAEQDRLTCLGIGVILGALPTLGISFLALVF